jgi:hypothetical protein
MTCTVGDPAHLEEVTLVGHYFPWPRTTCHVAFAYEWEAKAYILWLQRDLGLCPWIITDRLDRGSCRLQ